jgi:hypothetical protein
VNDIPNSPPILPIRHKNHPFPTTTPRHHRLRMSTRINRTPSINQFLERLATINPNKRRGPPRGTEYLAIVPRPLNYHRGRVVLELVEGLVD